jgi:dihydrofolate synthase/folylpolyglutamate synthase
MPVIVRTAAEVGAPLVAVESPSHELLDCRPMTPAAGSLLDEGRFAFRYRTPAAEYEIQLNLRGEHQVHNARTAIHIAEAAMARGVALNRAAVEVGLRRVVWPGRLEVVELEEESRRVPVLLDGAHNPAGAEYLRDYLARFCAGRPITMIFGVLADKAIDEMAALLFPFADTLIATRIHSPRTAEPQSFASHAARHGTQAIFADNAAQALELALPHTPPRGVICVCGSLYLIGEVKQALAARRARTA